MSKLKGLIRNCHVLAFDNLSGVQDWLSDALCNISTGGGYSTRALYSDRDENIMSASNPVLCNGIPELATRADLRDRTLLVALDKLDDTDRVDEKALWAEFEDARPRLLGALLDAVSAALRHWSDVKMTRKPRLVDFARWVCAAEMSGALPWEPGRFLEVYLGQRDAISVEALESDPLAQAVLQLVEGDGTWTGTAAELLVDLGARVDDQTKRSKTWPQTPRNLSNRLRRLAPDLRRGTGIEISFTREGHEWKRVIKIEHVCKSSSATSATSASAKKARNDAVFRADANADDMPTITRFADDGADDKKPVPTQDQFHRRHDKSQKTLDTQGIFGTADDADHADDKMQAYSLRVVDEL